MPKVLVCGDVGGNLPELYKRVATINAKSGPFDCLFCVGEFFASAEVGGEEEGDQQPNFMDQDPLKDYAKGTETAPVRTYFICGKEWGPRLDQTSSFQEVAPNIFFLGSHGIREVEGMRVAFLSGKFPLHAAGTLENMQAKEVISAHSPQKPVDVFLSAQWPSGVSLALQGTPGPDLGGREASKVGSSAVSGPAKRLAPRYHFAASEGLFFERAPYMNPPAGDSGAGVAHPTRFIALARVGNPDKKNRWLYAANITAVAAMESAQLTAAPQNATPSPYVAPAPSLSATFAGGGSLGTVNPGGGGGGGPAGPLSEVICHVQNLPFKISPDGLTFAFAPCGEVVRVHIATDRETGKPRGFGFVEFKEKAGAAKAVAMSGFDVQGRSVRVSYAPERQDAGQKRGGQEGAAGDGKRARMERHPLMMRTPDCWFCLSSPKVEKHLVVSIGDEVYVALAKGPLVPEHVLILPITHYTALSQLPDAVWEEVEKYLASLEKCFRQELKQGLVWYERACQTRGGMPHCHLQVVPVPAGTEERAGSHIQGMLSKHNMEFVCKQQWREEELDQYLVFQQPSAKASMLHKIPPGVRHPLNFGREVLATLLEMPQRQDWKDCALSLQEEEQCAADFKKLFKPYDWSLQ